MIHQVWPKQKEELCKSWLQLWCSGARQRFANRGDRYFGENKAAPLGTNYLYANICTNKIRFSITILTIWLDISNILLCSTISGMDFAFKWGDEGTTGWWLTYPSEKSEFVPYSQHMESHKNHVPNHQPDYDSFWDSIEIVRIGISSDESQEPASLAIKLHLIYPLVNIQQTIENGHRNSGFFH